MPSKFADTLKGMKGIIFSDRTPVRAGTIPRAKDEAWTGLISDVAGPSSDGGTGGSGCAGSTSAVGTQPTEHQIQSPDQRTNSRTGKNGKKSRGHQNYQNGGKKNKISTRSNGGSVRSHIHPSQLPQQQQIKFLKDQHQSQHNSAQQVHIWSPGPVDSSSGSGVGGDENHGDVVRHYMESCNNTPLRKPRRPRGESGGGCEDDGDDDDDDMRILLNVGGIRHETHATTLRHIPNSRLSRLAEQHLLSGSSMQEYFFDRHPAVFNSIIDFYRTGK